MKPMLDLREAKTIGKIESYYLRNKRQNISIALENIEGIDWYWSREENAEFDALWSADTPIKEMAVELDRSELSILLNAFDRMACGKIKPREGWKIW